MTVAPGGRARTEPPVEMRALTSHEDLRACVALQRRTWGDTFDNVAPPSILKVVQRLGGVAVGAFDPHGSLIGFVFGITGIENGTIVHWSDMLAVLPEARNMGIGRRLKEFQRRAVAKVGAKTIYWTFDPLVARNAHVNLNVLGVRVVEYVEDMYGESASPLHRGIGTDRFIVAWAVDDAALAARRAEIAHAATAEGKGTLHVEVPWNIAELQMSDATAARGWRDRTRRAFQKALAGGYTVQGLKIERPESRGYYLLTR
jgi:predicted GNAT superfamily acetyltransferase